MSVSRAVYGGALTPLEITELLSHQQGRTIVLLSTSVNLTGLFNAPSQEVIVAFPVVSTWSVAKSFDHRWPHASAGERHFIRFWAVPIQLGCETAVHPFTSSSMPAATLRT